MISGTLFGDTILDEINIYRVDKGLKPLKESKNLELSAKEHLNYLIKNSFITHEGEDGVSLESRATGFGATALSFGEVIGFSPKISDLITAWKMSPDHRSVILDENWTWAGGASTDNGEFTVAVVNFSTGNLGSTVVRIKEELIYIDGEYIYPPKFSDYLKPEELKIENGFFSLVLKAEKKSLFIYSYDRFGQLSDRLDIFFK